MKTLLVSAALGLGVLFYTLLHAVFYLGWIVIAALIFKAVLGR